VAVAHLPVGYFGGELKRKELVRVNVTPDLADAQYFAVYRRGARHRLTAEIAWAARETSDFRFAEGPEPHQPAAPGASRGTTIHSLLAYISPQNIAFSTATSPPQFRSSNARLQVQPVPRSRQHVEQSQQGGSLRSLDRSRIRSTSAQ
jgi:hypothetical protein